MAGRAMMRKMSAEDISLVLRAWRSGPTSVGDLKSYQRGLR